MLRCNALRNPARIRRIHPAEIEHANRKARLLLPPVGREDRRTPHPPPFEAVQVFLDFFQFSGGTVQLFFVGIVDRPKNLGRLGIQFQLLGEESDGHDLHAFAERFAVRTTRTAIWLCHQSRRKQEAHHQRGQDHRKSAVHHLHVVHQVHVQYRVVQDSPSSSSRDSSSISSIIPANSSSDIASS